MATRPSRHDEFEIAVVCARPLEYDAAALAFDEFWDDDGDMYGRAAGDTDTYCTGRIGRYNVVLALLPNMDKASEASAAASLRSSFTGLRLAIVMGICGGVPNPGTDDEIILGDVIISRTVVQYDYGRKYPDGFIRRDTLDDNLGRPNRDIRSLLSTFETDRGRDGLQRGAAQAMNQIREKAAKRRRRGRYVRPSASEDRLFKPDYQHEHRNQSDCGCFEQVCEAARAASCAELGCDTAELVPRERLQEAHEVGPGDGYADNEFEIYIGCVGSGDTVTKTGEGRDRIAGEHGLIAFEMEGAGVWDEVPCIVVKGVCDYADSHKNKKWQTYAAATAASVMKALLARYTQTDKPSVGSHTGADAGVGLRSSGPVFNGPITGKNVLAGHHTSGGTTNITFGS
ncbi:phosphorylase superfamily protein [Colletotrichum graminicola]|uniref:Phosphorylase superfamily protein n=1 Tax=Colletotrichum graminicola (strain M1.001 / M2 / FGSC 10212) TaxID=645133 RepID=E3Q7R1_COLGM|nr:phosphorylase superfamily protein [Colletotrichum graminicola M1.001]EFQ26923.1 phosphorylase superfamily protein [Colletotrichum graminicola M1.001]WDK16634.1 phosphorylase superfamily protein [Colletotrichum graminicola]